MMLLQSLYSVFKRWILKYLLFQSAQLVPNADFVSIHYDLLIFINYIYLTLIIYIHF
jgi:hypothetical protein